MGIFYKDNDVKLFFDDKMRKKTGNIRQFFFGKALVILWKSYIIIWYIKIKARLNFIGDLVPIKEPYPN